jgi:hypothetical protein|tara:strand:- start:7397 stop:8215 length:819 start_codon:yes stop_codon:yes gene_type:complete
MKSIKFPSKYLGNGDIGNLHFKFAKTLLSSLSEFNVIDDDNNKDESLWPSFIIDNKIIMFDYQDFKSLHHNYKYSDICLKTQYTDKMKDITNVFPWSQISFNDWPGYFKLRKEIKYSAKTDLVLNNQKPYGNAKGRRDTVRLMLKGKYGSNVSATYDLPQNKFFEQINDCLVYVHVPGYSNNMFDRAHGQMFGFGCCLITTEIPNTLPNNLKPIPGTHYLKCKDDYSDLINLIEWCKKNRVECIKIGNNAQQLFDESLTPDAMNKHLKKILE